MITKKQLKIFETFKNNVFKEYTIKELKEYSKEKSNNAITIAIKKFKQEKLIEERKIGRSLLYSLNLDNNVVFDYISLINNNGISNIVKKSIRRIQQELDKHSYFYSIVIFGSYAKNKQKNKSDLDIAVFIEKSTEKNIIKAALKSARDKTPLTLDGHTITKNDFLEMLKADYENLGKEIARKHLTLHNPLIFYSLLREGAKNGFKP